MSRRVNLNVIEVDEPCTESWDAMRGQGEVRFCGVCRMNVYNLSEMTADEAARLIERDNGQLCVRFYRRADGTVTTADCEPARFAALQRRARKVLTSAGVVMAGLFSAALGAAFFLGRDEDAPCAVEDPAPVAVQQIGVPVAPLPVQPVFEPPPVQPVFEPPPVREDPPSVEPQRPVRPVGHRMGRMMIRR